TILYWAYQILAVALLAAASMTAFQDLQATAWRDVAIGEIPEVVVYRNPQGTFTRSVTAGFIVAVVIQLLVKGNTSAAVPYYGIGVFMPIMVMGFAIRKHILQTAKGSARAWGSFGAGFAALLSGIVFIGQIVGKWSEGGWVVLITFSILVLAANALLISPIGFRDPLREQVLLGVTHLFEWFGVRRPIRFEPVPIVAGDYDHALHSDHPEAPSLLEQYIDHPAPRVGGAPKETAPAESNS